MNATQRNQLADTYAAISDTPGLTVAQLEERCGHKVGHWATSLLLEQGMVVRLTNTPGMHSVESRYATVRQVKSWGNTARWPHS